MNSSNPVIRAKMQKVLENIEQFDVSCFPKFNDFVMKNQGRDTEYYINNIEFHTFTKESFEYLINQINTHKNTYHNMGPFINKDGRWYSDQEHPENLEQLINSQQNEINDLKNLLKRLHPNIDISKCIVSNS
jgi:hypothetical protein